MSDRIIKWTGANPPRCSVCGGGDAPIIRGEHPRCTEYRKLIEADKSNAMRPSYIANMRNDETGE
jgi:hypothetical protein